MSIFLVIRVFPKMKVVGGVVDKSSFIPDIEHESSITIVGTSMG